MNTSSSKEEWRHRLKQIRASLSSSRRQEAAKAAQETLSLCFRESPWVLSYAPFDTELDLWPLNEELAERGQLLLPRVEGEHLTLFSVHSPQSELKRSAWGIQEPDPSTTKRVLTLDEKGVILLPALGFTPAFHRIGYGKGYYDRLLAEHPLSPAYGVGFREQLMEGEFTPTGGDIPLDDLFLF